VSELNLRSELKSVIAEITEVDDFSDDANFVTELGVDSMLALEIVARIEKRYHIRIPEDRFVELQTLDAAEAVVADLLQQTALLRQAQR
jgi:acyl carrier protein